MKLLRDFVFLRVLRRLRAGRGAPVRSYTVTVPAPLARAADHVVELSRSQPGSLPRAAATRRASFARAANQ